MGDWARVTRLRRENSSGAAWSKSSGRLGLEQGRKKRRKRPAVAAIACAGQLGFQSPEDFAQAVGQWRVGEVHTKGFMQHSQGTLSVRNKCQFSLAKCQGMGVRV